MKSYDPYEFKYLLKMGLWTGGEISDIGYVSGAREVDSDPFNAGIFGIYLGSGLMLEQDGSGNSSGRELTFSIEEPYSGTYIFYMVSVDNDNITGLVSALSGEKERNIVWSHNIYKKNPYKIERKYQATHSSIRSGTIRRPNSY